MKENQFANLTVKVWRARQRYERACLAVKPPTLDARIRRDLGNHEKLTRALDNFYRALAKPLPWRKRIGS